MKPTTGRILIMVLISLSLCSCRSPSEASAREESFTRLLNTQNVNGDLRMEVLAGGDSFDRDVSFDFVVENMSTDSIVLPYDFGARGFYYVAESQAWLELDNVVSYYPRVPILLAPRGREEANKSILGFNPDESGVRLPIRLRVVVYGRIYREGSITDEVVAAYADVTISEMASTGS